MRMMTKLMTAGAVAAAMTAGAAQAATLSIQGGEEVTLNAGFSLGGVTGLSAGSKILSFDSNNIGGNGLKVSATTKLRFTFIGKEAGATNLAFSAINPANPVGTPANANELFNNQTSTVGSFVDLLNIAGFVNFLFETSGLDDAPNNENNGDGISSGNVETGFAIIRNGTGADDTRISLGLYQNMDGSVYAFFGDGRGDSDYDDMAIRISAVPVPAAGFLLIGALGGLAALRRRKTA